MKRLVLLITSGIFLYYSNCFSANYYWVGNGGNWSDYGSHWATSSGGGSFRTQAPTTADNVYFDANSFSSGSQTVTIDANANCANIDFTGVTNTPTLDGTSSYTLTCAGSLTFVAGITYSFAGNVNFTGTSTHTITSANKTFSGSVLFNGAAGQWTFQDAFTVTNQLGIQTGTVVMNGMAVSTGTLNANVSGDNARAINFGASLVTVTGSSTCVDLRGNTANLSLTVSTSTISCTTTSNLTIQTGTAAKNIPNLLFPNITTGNITITTGNAANRITFGSIVKSTAPPSLSTNGSTGAFTLTGPTMNTFGNISFPANTWITIRNRDGTSYGSADRSIYVGTVVYANTCKAYHYGSYTNYQQAVTFGSGVDMYYQDRTEFDGTLTSGSTVSGFYGMEFRNGAQFDGPVIFSGSSKMQFYNNTVDFNSTLTTNSYGFFYLYYFANATVNFNGNVTIGALTEFYLGNGGTGTTNFGATLSLNSQARLYIDNGSSTTTINNISLNFHNAVFLNTSGTTSVTGTLTSSSGCNTWNILRSMSQATQASVSFSAPQIITGNVIQDLNVTTANLTNNGGMDMGNNTGITFGVPVASNAMYWVGNTTGNTKTGTYSTGVNNNWSNPDNWSFTSGVYSGTNSCIPNAVDNVVFDAASFSAGAANVNPDLRIIICNDMTWTGIPSGVTFDNDSTVIYRALYIYGNLSWGGSNMTNSYEGTTNFYSTDATARTITNNGSRFYGPVQFNYPTGNWTLVDNMDVQNLQYGDVTISAGTLSVGTNTITLDGDWEVKAAGTYSFTAGGNATVTFDCVNTNTGNQAITISGVGIFNNLREHRGVNRNVVLTTPITISKNFSITQGTFLDQGYQITGNATGTMSITDYRSLLYLGTTGLSTLFPTNYAAANISLDSLCEVVYNSSIDQTVSGVPDYGILVLGNTTSSLKTKTLTEPVTIKTELEINDYNNFSDGGYQIRFGIAGTNTIEMDPNSKFTIGTTSSATSFPTSFTPSTIDFDHVSGSTVIYNGGSAQTIQGLSGASPANYSHLQLSQPGAGSVTKTLDANTIVRGNITIDASNVMDVSGSNYSITVGGNWTNNGTFTEQSGTVTFAGSTTQTINANGGTETFYNLTFNNTDATGISFTDDIVVTNISTFTDGYVTPAAAEIFYFTDNATVASASNASYVDGKVRKIGNDSFVFPAGDDGYYAPIEITAPSVNTDHFTAQYINTDPNGSYSVSSRDASIHHLSRCEYWTLDRTGGSSDVSVTLSWGSPRSCGVTTLPDLVVAGWDGAQWKDKGNGGTTGNTTTGTVVSSSTVTVYGPFTLASSTYENPLPIELLSFTASLISNKHVSLYWTSSSEINNDYFSVERSEDGVHFKEIGIVDGAGNSSSVNNYQFFDSDLPTTNYQKSIPFYYRLKQTDYDGSFSYSQIEAINFGNSNSSEITVYPNPTTSEKGFTITFDSQIEIEILVIVLNVLGEELYSKMLPLSELNLSPAFNVRTENYLPNGIYFVTASSGDQQLLSKKIVVKN